MNFVNDFNFYGVEAQQIPCITGEGAPTETTEGEVGCLYMDILSVSKDVYKCVSSSNGFCEWIKLVDIQYIKYYTTLSGAIADVNADTIGVNATATKETAVASVRVENGEKIVTLLKDTTETGKIYITTDMTFDLNGKCLEFGAPLASFRVETDNVTFKIIGEKTGSKITKNLISTTKAEYLCVAKAGTCTTIGGEYAISIGDCAINPIFVLGTQNTGCLNVYNCKIVNDVKSGQCSVYGIFNDGNTLNVDNCIIHTNSTADNASAGIVNWKVANLKNTKIFADGLGGNNAEHSNISIGVWNVDTGVITLVDCKAYGTHSGIHHLGGACYINGGVYESPQHGGFYLGEGSASEPKTMFIENAILRATSYKGNNKSQITYELPPSGFYVSSGSNMSVYLENCIIKGGNFWVMAIGGSNNAVYMSNCTIDKNTTNYTNVSEIDGNYLVGLTDDEIAILKAEEGYYKTLPRLAVRIDDKTNSLNLGYGNNFKINHLVGFSINHTNKGYTTLQEVAKDTPVGFYVRDLIEEGAS